MPPISKYYDGAGEKVMQAMKREYGGKRGKQVFYATANKEKQNEKAHVSELGRKSKRK